MFVCIDFDDLKKRHIFSAPKAIYRAQAIEEVCSVLALAEKAQKEGNYVVGYVSYEASPAFDKALKVKKKPLANEDYALFIVFEAPSDSPLVSEADFFDLNWQSMVSKEAYNQAISQIKHEIKEGNTYQVNYTMPLKAEGAPLGFSGYEKLKERQGARYNAYFDLEDSELLSLSPELFFELRGERLITRPMKGTAPRGVTFKKDRIVAQWLAQDEKNLAENKMIVDLLRNDMGKISEIGSVEVTALATLEQYHTVWQMTSTIESRLKKETGLVEIFKALFPCGSITGAPKVATMKVIDDLEPYSRGVYCGTIGILCPNGDSIWNVAIRTILTDKKRGTHYYGVGGGITWDSEAEDEYQETVHKSEILKRERLDFELFTTGLVEVGVLRDKEAHLARLKEACLYYGYPYLEEKLKKVLKEALEQVRAPHRLRLSLSKTGEIRLDLKAYQPGKTPLFFRLAQQKEGHEKVSFTYFKTSYRPHLSEESLVYYNQKGELLEGSFYNLILEKEGKWYTPREDLGLLQGLTLKALLKEGKVQEALLTLEDLKNADKVYGCNALRGLFELIEIKSDPTN